MSTITVPSENLVAALTAVLPHAGVDDTLPILTCVHFETRDDELLAVTTDRYSLATYRVDATEVTGEVSANLTGRDAKELLAFAKKAKRVPLILTFDDDRELTVSDFERTVTYRLWEAEFVKWAAVLPTDESDRDLVGLNAHNVAKFAKGLGRNDETTLILGVGMRNKLITARIGDRFVGAIMPVRLPDESKGETATYHDGGNVTVTKAPEPEPVAPQSEAPVSPDEPAEDDEANTQWHESEVELADDPQAEDEVPDVAEGEVGAEPTELDCPSCKGFGVVKGKPAADGTPRPFRTANGAATATTAVECPTCHGDRIAAA